MLLPRPTYLPAGTRELPSSAETRTPCEWPGISDSSRLTVSEPPVSPRSCSDNPGPWPGCMGARPCRSGSAKFDLPLPPYVVPNSENSAVFCESGRSWPSHQAQPLGAKLNGKIRISATNGSAMTNSGWTGEETKQRNDVVNAQIRLKIRVRLAAADRADGRRSAVGVGSVLPVEFAQRACRRKPARGVGGVGRIRRREQRVAMSGDLIDGQRDLL